MAVGGHHGVPPEHGQIQALDRHPHLLRTHGPSRTLWKRAQEELLDACANEFGVREHLAAWRAVKLPQPVQVLLSALVIVSDWIASNPDLFPYFPEDVPRTSASTTTPVCRTRCARNRGRPRPGTARAPRARGDGPCTFPTSATDSRCSPRPRGWSLGQTISAGLTSETPLVCTDVREDCPRSGPPATHWASG
ncbi:HD domain-containing protein [Streptomyces sp. NPDC001292]|uniref:HD domain-containing protein n=1 Tax=Streptomyces sp. NPDC001292 TaxID=3364558 RepID=UPI0036A86287